MHIIYQYTRRGYAQVCSKYLVTTKLHFLYTKLKNPSTITACYEFHFGQRLQQTDRPSVFNSSRRSVIREAVKTQKYYEKNNEMLNLSTIRTRNKNGGYCIK